MFRFVSCLALAVLLAGCQPSDVGELDPSLQVEGPGEPAPVAEMPVGRLGDAVVPQHYELDLVIVPERERFSGRVSIAIDIRKPSELIWLHGNRLDVTEAWLEQGEVRIDMRYSQVDDTGVARLDLVAVPQAGPAQLHFEYDAPFDQALEGLYKVVEEGRAYAFTQFEATSARLAFPGFDEPAFKTPFEIHVAAPANQVVITSTPEVASRAMGDGLVRRSYAVTPPLPTYLIAFAVGPLDVVEWEPVPANEIRNWPLPLRGVAAAGKGGQLTFALANTARLVHALERYFDYEMPYPKLDIIAVPDFAAGAMENVGAITYREQLLLLDENESVRRKRAYASVHGHELAHQWFGNLVTPKWWDDIWLNESFASWMAAKAAHQAFPDLGFEDRVLGRAIGVMNADALETARQVRQPVETNHDIANAFDGITYAKGGAVLSMFEAWVGEAAFRAGVRLHLKRFANDIADYEDFLTSLAEGSGRPELVDAFSSFLFRPGVPLALAAQPDRNQRPAGLEQEAGKCIDQFGASRPFGQRGQEILVVGNVIGKTLQVQPHARAECGLAHPGLEHRQHRAALGVGDAVERVGDIMVGLDRLAHLACGLQCVGVHDADRAAENPVLEPEVRKRLVGRLGRHPGRERLVQPDIVPPLRRHQVAKPLVGQFVAVHRRVGALAAHRVVFVEQQ